MLLSMPARKARPNVVISSSQDAMRIPRKKITALVGFVAAQEGAAISDVDLAVVSRSEIAAVNRRWAGRTGATDVVSFDLSDARTRGISAQLVVCGDIAAEQGRVRGCGVQRELMLYVVHGLLHLMGYDDGAIRAAAKMHAREDELLTEFLAKSRRRSARTRSTRRRRRR